MRDCGKSPWAKDLFIKFESIGAKVMTFVLSMSVGMLSHPALLLFLKFLRISVVIIIIIKKGWQCKAEREWYTLYQSEDPSPPIPTYRQKEEKGKKSRRL